MKKVKTGFMVMLLTLGLSVPVFGDIKVPGEVKKMDPVEAYKKGFEDGSKNTKPSVSGKKSDPAKGNPLSEKNSDLMNEAIDCDVFEITITKIEKEKDLLKITYDFKNKSDTTSPWLAGNFQAFQEGVELDDKTLDNDITVFTKQVQKDGVKKGLVRIFKLESDTDTVTFEVGGFFGPTKEFEISLE